MVCNDQTMLLFKPLQWKHNSTITNHKVTILAITVLITVSTLAQNKRE